VTTLSPTNDASTRIGDAITRVATARSSLGASQNRIEFASDNLATTIANVEHARSGLMDLDMASEITRFTAGKLLADIGVSALAQANTQAQSLLRLFN
jgi:flagellin